MKQYIKCGVRIKDLRNKAGLFRKTFADMLQIPYTTLRNYETDQREADYATLTRMAHHLNTTTDYFLGLTAESTPARILPCDLNDTVYIVHRFLTAPPCIEPVVYKKLLATIDELPFGHHEAYLTEQEATAAIKVEAAEKAESLMEKCGN